MTNKYDTPRLVVGLRNCVTLNTNNRQILTQCRSCSSCISPTYPLFNRKIQIFSRNMLRFTSNNVSSSTIENLIIVLGPEISTRGVYDKLRIPYVGPARSGPWGD